MNAKRLSDLENRKIKSSIDRLLEKRINGIEEYLLLTRR